MESMFTMERLKKFLSSMDKSLLEDFSDLFQNDSSSQSTSVTTSSSSSSSTTVSTSLTTSSSSSSSIKLRSYIQYSRRWKQIILERGPFRVIEPLLRVPLVAKPWSMKEMIISFRYMNNERPLTLKTLNFPSTLQERFLLLSQSLGLSFNSQSHSTRLRFPYSRLGRGLRGLVNNIDCTNIVIDAFTKYDGFYGRFIVLVSLGIGCTVWVEFAPIGLAYTPHYDVLCTQVEPLEYTRFLRHDYDLPGFQKVGYVETKDVTPTVASAMRSEQPFSEIQIPASGTLLKGVALGVMLVFLLTVGISPDYSEK